MSGELIAINKKEVTSHAGINVSANICLFSHSKLRGVLHKPIYNIRLTNSQQALVCSNHLEDLHDFMQNKVDSYD